MWRGPREPVGFKDVLKHWAKLLRNDAKRWRGSANHQKTRPEIASAALRAAAVLQEAAELLEQRVFKEWGE